MHFGHPYQTYLETYLAYWQHVRKTSQKRFQK